MLVDDPGMTKLLTVAAVVAVVAVLGRRGARKMESMDWEKAFERMPENAPPKWMFRNISAIRQNTERILELLERERAGKADQPTST